MPAAPTGPVLPWPLPTFEVAVRRRPLALVQPGTDLAPVPYAAVEADLTDPGAPARVGLASGGDELVARWDGRTVALHAGGARLVSRRHGRPRGRRPEALALTLTGPLATAWVREAGAWVARARVDLTDPAGPAPTPVHDEEWLAGLRVVGSADRVGRFGQLGLRDLRAVSHADGTAYVDEGGHPLLTATSAGPGGFGTGHASVWSLDPTSLGLAHRGDLYFRRPETPGVFGDHACHLVRDGEGWLVATSTWGDFDRVRSPHVAITLARSNADLSRGLHVLDVDPLVLPTDSAGSVGVWDPQLLRTDTGWLVAHVSATRFFRFHPVLAQGPTLDSLRVRATAPDRIATEGPVLVPTSAGLRLLASDGRDGRRRHPPGYPVLDPDLREVGRVEAHYPGNIPWPTLVPGVDDSWLMVGFDGHPTGGALPGYGTHGRVVIQRSRSR